MDTQETELVELGEFSIENILKSWLVKGQRGHGADDDRNVIQVQQEIGPNHFVYIEVFGHRQADGRYKLTAHRETKAHRIRVIKQFYKSIAY